MAGALRFGEAPGVGLRRRSASGSREFNTRMSGLKVDQAATGRRPRHGEEYIVPPKLRVKPSDGNVSIRNGARSIGATRRSEHKRVLVAKNEVAADIDGQ